MEIEKTQILVGGATILTGVGAYNILKHFNKDIIWAFPIAILTMGVLIAYVEHKNKKLKKEKS